MVLMPRSNRPKNGKGRREEPAALNLDVALRGVKHTLVKRGVEYTVQTSSGANAEDDKQWICPHCNMVIVKGVVHIVAFDTHRGVGTRRHFHNACWASWQGSLL